MGKTPIKVNFMHDEVMTKFGLTIFIYIYSYAPSIRLGLFYIRRILVASNAIDMINLIKLRYLLFKLHSTRPKFDQFRRKTGLRRTPRA